MASTDFAFCLPLVQHGSFGGAGLGLPEDSVYCAGSDDFRVYAWAIPSWEALKRTKGYFKSERWLSETSTGRIGAYPRCLHQ